MRPAAGDEAALGDGLVDGGPETREISVWFAALVFQKLDGFDHRRDHAVVGLIFGSLETVAHNGAEESVGNDAHVRRTLLIEMVQGGDAGGRENGAIACQFMLQMADQRGGGDDDAACEILPEFIQDRGGFAGAGRASNYSHIARTIKRARRNPFILTI